MKRKRGHKSKKSKKLLALEGISNDVDIDPPSQTSQEISEGVEEDDNNETESQTETDMTCLMGLSNAYDVKLEGSADNAVGKPLGRVKVKLKTSVPLGSDIPSHSDTERSSPHITTEKSYVVAEKVEDTAVSLPARKPVFLGQVYKKSGGLKIKSSKGLSAVIPTAEKEKSASVATVEDEKTVEKESGKFGQSSRQYDKQELDDALTVIRKVMKMDAAEPFNVPVNPEALGIPDYFDVIDTPMDFGTICSNLENSNKYKNSEDVFRDVQYIWDNCSKYNKKGDYIMDLMKRVKKNFMKYWTAAGLYTDHAKREDTAQGKDGAQSNQGKTHGKHKSHKKHGRRHKHDCLCAICILKRRKREREVNARISKGHMGIEEEFSPVESASIADSSHNMGENFDTDAEMDVKHEGGKMETEQRVGSMEENYTKIKEETDGEDDDNIRPKKRVEIDTKDKSEFDSRQSPLNGAANSTETRKTLAQSQTVNAENRKQKLEVLRAREWRKKMSEKFQIENPVLLRLGGILFPGNGESFWAGPHSLGQQRGPAQTGSIHQAVQELLE